MLRTVNDQLSLWDAILPPELLVLPAELARVDVLLDDPAFFAPFVPYFDPRIGRPSVPMETYLRMMFLKSRHRLGYETLCREVGDSISWQRFCRIPFGTRVPHPTTLMKRTSRCGEAAVAGLNEALLVKAAAQKLVRTDKVRADTTVVEAAVAYPTDSGLLAKAVGGIAKTVKRIQAAGGATRTRVRDRSRSAGQRARSIAAKLRLRGAAAREEGQAAVLRITGQLADIAEAAMADAQAVVRNARRGLVTATGQRRARLHRAITDLSTLLARTEQVVSQTHSRLTGVMPDSASRIVSFHDVDARPIRKGRLGKPVEFGYKAQIVDNADGIILDHTVQIGNPADAPSWRRPSPASPNGSGVFPSQSLQIAATDTPRSRPTCTTSESATSRSRAPASPVRPAGSSSTEKHSAPKSNGGPAAKDESTTSSAATDGTAPS